MNTQTKIAIVVGALCAAYFFRYEVTAAGPIAYKLDRWTGNVTTVKY